MDEYVMTVKIYQKNGATILEMDHDQPHPPGKGTFVLTRGDIERAKAHVLAYAGGPVKFVEA